MPSRRVTVRGGRRLTTFLVEFQRVSVQIVLQATAEVIQTVVLPQLRAATPVRTGRLRSSLRAVVRGGGVEIRGRFYGRFVGLPERAVELIDAAKPAIVRLVRARLRSRYGSI